MDDSARYSLVASLKRWLPRPADLSDPKRYISLSGTMFLRIACERHSEYRWICIYPTYLNWRKNFPEFEGRKIAKDKVTELTVYCKSARERKDDIKTNLWCCSITCFLTLSDDTSFKFDWSKLFIGMGWVQWKYKKERTWTPKSSGVLPACVRWQENVIHVLNHVWEGCMGIRLSKLAISVEHAAHTYVEDTW